MYKSMYVCICVFLCASVCVCVRIHDDDETDAYMPPLNLSRTRDHSGKISIIV